mgnify:CR=1 FL=1
MEQFNTFLTIVIDSIKNVFTLLSKFSFIELVVLLICITLLVELIKWAWKSYKKPGIGYFRYVISCLLKSKYGDTSDLEWYEVCSYCKRPLSKKRIEKRIHFCSRRCKRWSEEEARQIIRHNNRCDIHKFSRVTLKNECIECIRDKWMEKHNLSFVRKGNSLSLFLLTKFYGFKWFPTMRTSKNSWNGDKLTFEALLDDKGYQWIVYIKFSCEKGRNSNSKPIIRPLVVGKSGSILVNASGSDLSFSTDPEHGPARRKLIKEKKSWYYDYILIKNFTSQRKAYAFESKIMRKFNLFGS